MNNYEVLYVIDGTLSDEAINEQVAKFTELVNANGGEVVQVDEWGKRRLAYQINYKSEGYYVLMNFKSGPDFPAELERNFGINEGIMRYMLERKPADYVPPKKAAKPKAAKKPEEAEAPAEAAQEAPPAKEASAQEAPAEEAPKQEAPAKKAKKAAEKAVEETPAQEQAEAPAEDAKEDEPEEKEEK